MSDLQHTLLNKEIDIYLRNILKSLLHFNPNKRMTASGAIQSLYFEDIRDPSKERLRPTKFRLPIDKDAAFDFEARHSQFTKEELIELIEQETHN